MRVPGWCTECRRVRNVSASPAVQALAFARGIMVLGLCWECEEARSPVPPRGAASRRGHSRAQEGRGGRFHAERGAWTPEGAQELSEAERGLYTSGAWIVPEEEGS